MSQFRNDFGAIIDTVTIDTKADKLILDLIPGITKLSNIPQTQMKVAPLTPDGDSIVIVSQCSCDVEFSTASARSVCLSGCLSGWLVASGWL